MQLYTTSGARCFLTCPRKYHYRYNLRRRPRVEGVSLSFGRLHHAGLEQWLLTWQDVQQGNLTLEQVDPREMMMMGVQAAFAGMDDDEHEIDEHVFAMVGELLIGYHYRWSEWIQSVEILGVEQQFEAPLRNPETGMSSRTWRLAGKIDALIRVLDGPNAGVWLMEHKSSSEEIEPGADYWRRLRIDDQVSTYIEGAKAIGHEVRGCLYDVTRKTRKRPLIATPPESRKYTKKATKDADGNVRPAGSLYANMRENDETTVEYALRIRNEIADNPNAFYQMGEVVRLADEIEAYSHDAWQTAKSIRSCQLANAHPRNPGGCYAYNRFCDFYDVCCGIADINDPSRFIEIESPHPELSMPKEVATDDSTDEPEGVRSDQA